MKATMRSTYADGGCMILPARAILSVPLLMSFTYTSSENLSDKLWHPSIDPFPESTVDSQSSCARKAGSEFCVCRFQRFLMRFYDQKKGRAYRRAVFVSSQCG